MKYEQLTLTPQQKQQFERLPEESVQAAFRKIAAKQQAGEKINNIASLALKIANDDVEKRVFLSQDSAKKKTEADRLAEIACKQLNDLRKEQRERYWNSEDMNHLQIKMHEARRGKELSQQSYDQRPTDINLRFLRASEQRYDHWRDIYIKSLQQHQDYIPLAQKIPLLSNHDTKIYAQYLGNLMPDKGKDEILMIKSTRGILNNPVMDTILEEYLKGRNNEKKSV